MPRHKDTNWNLPEGVKQPNGSRTHDWNSIYAALLMDIRDELKQLNRTFACINFQNMPHWINRTRVAAERLDRRLAKQLPLPKGQPKK